MSVIALVGHMTDEQKVAVRTRIAAVVDRLTTVLDEMIAALDQFDGDAEAEDNGDDEPTLARPEQAIGGMIGSTHDGEYEPSPGWTGNVNQASRNRIGGNDDYEDEHDGRENGGDTEPNGDEQDGEHCSERNPYRRTSSAAPSSSATASRSNSGGRSHRPVRRSPEHPARPLQVPSEEPARAHLPRPEHVGPGHSAQVDASDREQGRRR